MPGYLLSNKHFCNGAKVELWDNNNNANYGEMIGLHNCTRECDLHDECAGFSFRFDGKCGFWHRSPLNISAGPLFACYKKDLSKINVLKLKLCSFPMADYLCWRVRISSMTFVIIA